MTAWFERVKSRHDSKFKLQITVKHLNTDIRKGLISLNSQSESIQEYKSNYHSCKQHRLPHILWTWQNLSQSYESPHILDIWAFDYIHTSAASTDGSAWRNQHWLERSSDWLFMIEWQMEQGHNSVIRRRHAYVLSGPFLSPSVFPVFPPFHCSPSPHPAPHQPAAAASSLLPPTFATFLCSTFRSDEYKPLLFCKWLIQMTVGGSHQCLARCCMIKTCKVNQGYIYVY